MASWFGVGGFRSAAYVNILGSAPEPPVFNPLDISDCVLWLDANDSSTIDVNGDLSGVNVNRVMKWFDKAKPSNQNYYTHIGNPATSGLYYTHLMNKLNTVYFEPNAAMNHRGQGVTYNFQDRTFFAVIKPLTNLVDASGAVQPFISIYNGYTSGDMNTGFSYNSLTGLHQYTMCENGITCGIIYDLSNNPVKQRMLIMYGQGADASGNVGAYDTIYQTLTNSDPADSYNTSQAQYYLNDSTKGTAQDIAEILMYGRLLNVKEQQDVMDYLADKWNLSGPTPDGFTQTIASAPAPEAAPPAYTFIIYGIFGDGPPNWYWCDENAVTETPAVLAEGYDGTTALRDGLAVVVSGTFYA